MIRKFILRFLQRSDLLRFLSLPVLFLFCMAIFGGISVLLHRRPVIESLNPSIGEPGEVILVQGRHFGTSRGDSWIEIAGNRISGSSYLKWTDTTVMATLPATVEDGLVMVHTRNGHSNPLVFGNRNNIPVAARTDTELGLPEIASFDTENTGTGQRIVISGKNFGITRNTSSVQFSWQIDPALPVSAQAGGNQTTISCSERDLDYEFWSDQELRIRVPDGACSGNVTVRTDRGTSNALPVKIASPCGTKHYTNRRTYVLSLDVDISGISASEGNMLFLRVPVPEETPSQRGVEVTASSPKPYMDNYRGTILHQLDNLKTGKNEKISHSFLLAAYETDTAINPDQVKPWQDTERPLYILNTSPDALIPSDDQDLILKAAAIAGKEKNPYLKARLIYDWLTANIRYAPNTNPDRSIKEALATKTGDAFDTALLFCTLARASGIPSIPVAGILVDADRNSRVHWWAEFYLEGFGWVPVDPGLGAGMPGSFRGSDSRDWYFGNLDAYHIAFSRGWTDQKPMTPKSRIVYKPRSFAFQPVWEESGGNIRSYTSFWGEPKVTGVY